MRYLPEQNYLATPEIISIRSFIARRLGRWILSLLLATWPAGTGTDQLRQDRRTRQ
jgi:hypothetical protein